ncbi:hypothetical protein OBV_17500 [Oscillibacter valericigenes Sjm18-20]|nr:hypothetical protein OBV_17500 [Oscillibacter valericigenes Sjm18-20]
MEKKVNSPANGAGLFYYHAVPMEVSPLAAQMFYGRGAVRTEAVRDSQGFYYRKAD